MDLCRLIRINSFSIESNFNVTFGQWSTYKEFWKCFAEFFYIRNIFHHYLICDWTIFVETWWKNSVPFKYCHEKYFQVWGTDNLIILYIARTRMKTTNTSLLYNCILIYVHSIENLSLLWYAIETVGIYYKFINR